jgi:hypothetical protein
MQTVGLDRWQRFLSDAQDRARDPATVAAVETSRPPPSSDAVNSIPFGQIEAALGLGPAVMAGRGLVAALRAPGGAIFRRGLEDEPSASPRIDETFTPTSEILAPDGEMVGTVHPGATEEVRTVSPSEFRTLEERLLQGASPTNQPGYPGIWYQRPDGSSFGIRNSSRNGRTIDVSDPKLPSGLKVHQP